MKDIRLIVSTLFAFTAASTHAAKPLVFDAKIGYYKDLSYEALTDKGLSATERARLFGGETVHYGALTAKQRAAKEKELTALLAKLNRDLTNKCEADIRKWLDQQAKALPAAYAGRDLFRVRAAAVIFFRAYEIFGDKKFLEGGQRAADLILKTQWPKGHWPWPGKGENFVRVQDGYTTEPFWIMLYAHKLTGDKKYFESARRCADVLLSIQRPSGGWPDQWSFDGRGSGNTGVRNGISFNDNGTNAPFRIMVMMYHLTGDKKYITRLGKLGDFIKRANFGEGKVVGWAEQYHDNAKPTRARGYEIELLYPRTLTRGTGPLLIWLYLMTGEDAHINLVKKAYAWHEDVRQRELDPARIDTWDRMADSWTKAGRRMHYRPGWPDAWLPDGSNWGRVTAFKMIAWNPVSLDMKKKYGGLVHRSESDGGFPGNCGYLKKWGEDLRAGGKHPECSLGFSHASRGNSLAQVRRALLEHKRGGHKGLLKYYSHPTKFTADQYLQARIAAAHRVLEAKNQKLAADPENKGILTITDPYSLLAQKGRWHGGTLRHGERITKWGASYSTTGQYGSVAWYQWQLVYDTRLATGKIDADSAARGSRGVEHVASMHHLDSWDILGEWGSATHEVENFFKVPLPKE